MKLLGSILIALFLNPLAMTQSFVKEDLYRGAVIILEDVNFFSDQFTLIDDAYDELDLIAEAMNSYPKLSIEVSGHLDITDDKKSGKELTEKRAIAVKNYLIKKGAEEKRINAIGMGSSKPLIKEGSPLNQRIEISVVSNPHLKKPKGFDQSLKDPSLDLSNQKRVALIIGNGTYESSPSLRNPINDAKLMSETLQNLGFEVTMGLNLKYKDVLTALKNFSVNINKADVAVFYFAGHGLQVNGTNYLLPTDAVFENGETDVPFESINLELVLKIMEYTNSKCLNMVILDACRNNPFKTWTRGGDGLAEVKAPSGTLIAYSTSPGSLASDGDQDNGLYTSVLIKQLQLSQRVEDIFMNTRIEVENISNGRQSPWELSKLRGKFFLK